MVKSPPSDNTADAEASSTRKPEKKTLLLVLILVVALTLLGLLAAMFAKNESKDGDSLGIGTGTGTGAGGPGIGSLTNGVGVGYAVPMFSTGPSLQTNRNDPGMEGAKNNIFLDRHRLQCPSGSALQSFQLKRYDNPNQISYDYTCTAAVPNMSEREGRRTNSDADGGVGDNIIYLDRHNMTCPANKVMTDMQFQRDLTGNQGRIYYNYGCAGVPGKEQNCRDVTTPFTDMTAPLGSLYDLTQHRVACNMDEAIGRVQYIRDKDNNQGTKIGYRYTCCKIKN